LGTAHGKIVLDYDSDKAVGRAEKDIDKLERKAKESNGTLGKLGKTLSAFGAGAKIGALAISMGVTAVQAGALLTNVLGIVPQLVSILSLSSALPAIYTGLIGTVLTLKAAFAGVGDAVKLAFDPEKAAEYQKALEKLTPSARAFVEQLHNAAPALKTFQQEIQEAFFSSSFLAAQVPRMMKALEVIRPVVLGLAADFGEVTRRISDFALSEKSIMFVRNSLAATRAAFSEVSGSIVPVLIGLRDVGEVGLPLMVQLAETVGNVADRFGAWLSQIASDGRLQAWINTALDTLRTLGEIVSNVGQILFSVITAAQAAGGGLLGTLADITGQFAAFLSSADGMQTLTSLFSAILSVAHQLAPVIITLVSALAKALAPAIAQIAQVLGPVLLDVVNALAPAFGPLAAAIGDLVTALAPLLPPIAKLVALLAGVLSTAVQALVAELGPLISVIADGLSGALDQLMPLIGEMAKGLPLAAEAGIQLAQAFAPLIPVLIELAKVIVAALIKNMPAIRDAISKILPLFIEFANLLSAELVQALTELIKILPFLIDAFVKIYPILLQVETIGLRIVIWIFKLQNAIQGALVWIGKFVVGLVQGLVSGLQSAYNGIVTAGAAVIGWFQALPGRIMSALNALPGMLKDLFVKALEGLATVIGFSAGLIVGIFTKLPGKIANAIVTLGPMLWNWMQAVWAGIQQRVVNGVTNALNFLKNFPGRAYNAMLNLVSLLRTLATNAWNNLVNRFQSGANNAVNAAKNLPGRIRSALGNLGNLLLNSGINIINGLINGINRGISRVLNLVRNLADRVRNAFNSALDIFSPSRVFRDSGKNIGEGLILGLRDKLRAITATAELMANTVVAPTVQLPATASAAAMNVAVANPQRVSQDQNQQRYFGPYTLEVDGKVLASIVIDTVTGNPTVVSKAANEGNRQNQFAGSGRR
jgi:phage-related protein